MHIIHQYHTIIEDGAKLQTPRTYVFAGKAAPGYLQAKLIVNLINCVAEVIARDPLTSRMLNIVFLPNYDVTAMEFICPAAELSEQISTAGKEASGTGNMKFMMNGALTIGTLDGANIEIRERVGEDNFFTFGLTADEVIETRSGYDPAAIIDADMDLARVLKLIETDHFSMFEPGRFAPLTASIRSPQDPWMIAADFRSYLDTHEQVRQVYAAQDDWLRMSILNTACSGWFSSDRTIRDYARDIWHVEPMHRT